MMYETTASNRFLDYLFPLLFQLLYGNISNCFLQLLTVTVWFSFRLFVGIIVSIISGSINFYVWDYCFKYFLELLLQTVL